MTKSTKRRRFLILFAVLAVIVLALLLSSCTDSPKDASHLREQGHMMVTYDCNGGQISSFSQRTVYAKPGALIPEPGKYAELSQPVLRTYYELLGWFKGHVEEGEIVFGEQWDFATDRMGGEDITIYAKWAEQLKCVVKYGEDFELTEDTFRYISHFTAEEGRQVNRPAREPLLDGYTFINYYTDATLTTPCVFPLKHEGNIENNVLTIYARHIEGDWRVAYSPENLVGLGNSANVYLMNDIDMKSHVWTMPANYSGTFQGNGFTVKNIKHGVKLLGNANLNFGLFGILNGAKFIDVTFENCETAVELNISNSSVTAATGLFAAEIRGNTEFINVNVTGGKVFVIFNILSAELRANMINFDDEGLFGIIPQGYDLSGLTFDVERNFIYSSDVEISALKLEGYCQVVLDSNGGNTGIKYYYLNDKMLTPGIFASVIASPVKREGTTLLTLDGWYTGTKNGEVIVFDEEWDFDTLITNNLTVYAKWN